MRQSYEFWSIKMKSLFKSQYLWDLIETGFADPDEEQRLKENRIKDVKTLFFFQQAVHEMVFCQIAATTTSRKTWRILQTEFQDSSKVERPNSRDHDNATIGRGVGRGAFRGNSRGRSQCRGFEQRHFNEQRPIRSSKQCHHCKKFGHVQADCWYKEKQIGGRGRGRPKGSTEKGSVASRTRMVGMSVLHTQSGATIINSSTVITGDLGHKPTCGVKWKGKQAMTSSQLEEMRGRKQMETRSKAAHLSQESSNAI
ncbi:hypothetical protein KY290_000609 [Solanum tuberosum]|uniref:CCHC-type domain-containing protein n=1 Tax=Solanum tuberosum TaxID=4113 RepID=A0ABQ7WJT7_SOLTU|nr:hypothetical protein KY289_000673 [Solanum tuberosum]KAH0781011.1 hypothetical protein KY290_000609 [Solanum tuberosum]